ncbi:probable E3 ubiquitin-protein ligase XERICO [Beta vulgaris subsp. vulgaris]|uniref:probable E3 ubiquitin-protein ligase XERICO n=1 Tax=Beta vulgaris subsp. vulgaris TaxID=3555 RepID=UPI0020366750|nr:probable E3 ubiquitin-protein ligase XERICO [Beta vulgaris subsp. vulgaris]
MEVHHANLEVVNLARTAAETINKLANWGEYSKHHGLGPKEGDELMNVLAKINGQLAKVAMERAEASGRDFEAVFEETNLEFFYNEAKIMATDMLVDPREQAMKPVVVSEEERGEVCGVCQEEFEVAEEVRATACMHKFHGLCLWKWLYDHKTCPLCRVPLLM